MGFATGMGLRGVVGNLGVARLGPRASLEAAREALARSEVRAGQWAAVSRSYGAEELALFGRLTGDLNPIHVDKRFSARADGPLGPVEGGDPRAVHGLLFSSLFPALFANCVPASVYVSQTLRFRTPLRAGQELTAAIRVKRVRMGLALVTTEARLGGARLEEGDGGEQLCWPAFAEGDVVVEGEATVLLPDADVALAALEQARANAGH